MEKQGRSLLHIAAALVVGLVVAGAPAVYFYNQNSSTQTKEGQLNSQISSLQANVTATQARVSELRANITTLTTEKITLQSQNSNDATTINNLQSQINTLNQEVATDENTVQQEVAQINLLAAQVQSLQQIAAHENLSAVQTIDSSPLAWSGSPCTSACLTGAWFYGPYQVTDFAGYLKFVVTNPNPSNVQMQIKVTWDGYGISYSDTRIITGTGNATFPVLLTNDMNFTVQPVSNFYTGSVQLTVLWYD